MEVDWNIIVNALVALLGAGGVYRGAQYGYQRISSARAEAERRRAEAESDFGPINTGRIPALDVVTSGECSMAQRGFAESIRELKEQLKETAKENGRILADMSKDVGEIKQSMARQEAATIKAVNYGIREHEKRYHKVG